MRKRKKRKKNLKMKILMMIGKMAGLNHKKSCNCNFCHPKGAKKKAVKKTAKTKAKTKKPTSKPKKRK